MTDRTAELGRLAADLRASEDIADAFLAKSFTDRLLVVDLRPGTSLPPDARAVLADHDLQGAHDVYGTDGETGSHVGRVDGSPRHRFVDTRTRGDHQSYVVE